MESSENAMSSLADGTGGTYFHNSNDLNAGFKSLTEAPEYLYLLEISLNDVKPDGAFHSLKVKVSRPDTSVAGAPRLLYAEAREREERLFRRGLEGSNNAALTNGEDLVCFRLRKLFSIFCVCGHFTSMVSTTSSPVRSAVANRFVT